MESRRNDPGLDDDFSFFCPLVEDGDLVSKLQGLEALRDDGAHLPEEIFDVQPFVEVLDVRRFRGYLLVEERSLVDKIRSLEIRGGLPASIGRGELLGELDLVHLDGDMVGELNGLPSPETRQSFESLFRAGTLFSVGGNLNQERFEGLAIVVGDHRDQLGQGVGTEEDMPPSDISLRGFANRESGKRGGTSAVKRRASHGDVACVVDEGILRELG